MQQFLCPSSLVRRAEIAVKLRWEPTVMMWETLHPSLASQRRVSVRVSTWSWDVMGRMFRRVYRALSTSASKACRAFWHMQGETQFSCRCCSCIPCIAQSKHGTTGFRRPPNLLHAEAQTLQKKCNNMFMEVTNTCKYYPGEG